MAPLTMMLFVFKGRAKAVLGFVMAGIYICMLAGEINALVLHTSHQSFHFLITCVTPSIEEFLKAIPIFVFAFALKPSKQYLLECGIALGIGFALMENIAVLFATTDLTLVTAVFRGFGSGMMHGLCGLIIAIGAEVVVRRHKLIVPATLLVLAISIVYHSLYNLIIESPYEIFGIILPTLTFIPVFICLKLNLSIFSETREKK